MLVINTDLGTIFLNTAQNKLRDATAGDNGNTYYCEMTRLFRLMKQ